MPSEQGRIYIRARFRYPSVSSECKAIKLSLQNTDNLRRKHFHPSAIPVKQKPSDLAVHRNFDCSIVPVKTGTQS
jgi:hypothetical protein